MKRALVVGLGTSGTAAARLLLHRGVEVHGFDARATADVPAGVVPFVGADEPPAAAFAEIDAMVLSPGVPPTKFVALCRALAPNAAVRGELGLAVELLRERGEPRICLVTGTNGKSTVTALLGELLASEGRRTFVGGNLGVPPCAAVLAIERDDAPVPEDVVLECSSFQLETWPGFPTAVGIVLNVTPDHLDRYPDMEAYARTKARVFSGLGPRDLALVSDRDAWTDRIVPTGPRTGRVGSPGFAYVEGSGAGNALVLAADVTFPRTALGLPGRHNADNAVFALAAARHLGVGAATCERALRSFRGLPHRMALVRELDGVRWYNDSKATNVAAAVAGLAGLAERFVLLAGGRGKGDDLAPLAEVLHQRGRGLVAFGEAGDGFFALGRELVPAVRVDDLATAVSHARTMARPGDVVVLAPACASFDQFRSYAHRGEVFAAAVDALQASTTPATDKS